MQQVGDIFLVPYTAKAYSSFFNQLAFLQVKRYQQYFLELPSPAYNLVHIGLVSDWPYGIHATLGGGVCQVNIEKNYPEAIICRMRECISNNTIGHEIIRNASNYLGRDYDNMANFKFALPIITSYLRSLFGISYNCRSFNCISFVIQSIRDTGLKIGWELAPKILTPGMIYFDDSIVDINPTSQSINVKTVGILPEFVRKAQL